MPPSPSPIPKPSQVVFTPNTRRVPCKPSNARILTIRSAGPFTQGKREFSILIWCASSTHPCSESIQISNPADYAQQREGSLLTTVEGTPIRVQWKTVLHKNLMGEACDILMEEHYRCPSTPLEFYTPLLEFAKHFRQLFAGSSTISWARNYPTDIRPADELCLAFGKEFSSIHEKEQELSRSWSHCEGDTIHGHTPIPEPWRSVSDVIHIAVDASASRRNYGAYAYITSQGDFYAQASCGPILGCELHAIAHAVHMARDIPGRVVIWSDSRLALNQIARMRTDGALFLPRRFHQTLSLIQTDLRFRQSRGHDDIVFRWIKAHTDCSSLQRILNDGADRLARHTMRNVYGATFTPGLATVCEDIVADCMQNLALLQPCSALPSEADDDFAGYDSDHDIDSCG